jgi:subtilase family serine protease
MKISRLFTSFLGAMLCVSAAAAPPGQFEPVEKTPVFKPKPGQGYALFQDLEVTDISMTPQNPVAGQNVTLQFTVRNNGKIKTPEADLSVTVWDTQGGGYSGGTFYLMVPKVPSLAPGQSHTIPSSVQFITLGDHAGIEVTVDGNNKIKETDENNNKKFHYFSVVCKPDLSSYDYTKSPPPPEYVETYPNQEVKHTVWVYNNGWCDSKPAQLYVACDGQWPININIPPINGHQRAGLPVTLKWTEPGTRTCKFKVDQTNTNDESLENNNDGEFQVSVLGQWPQ